MVEQVPSRHKFALSIIFLRAFLLTQLKKNMNSAVLQALKVHFRKMIDKDNNECPLTVCQDCSGCSAN